nr:hypothetical protein [Lachnospiraceae bacterium]
YEEIEWLLNLAEENEKELIRLGVDFSDSQIQKPFYFFVEYRSIRILRQIIRYTDAVIIELYMEQFLDSK